MWNPLCPQAQYRTIWAVAIGIMGVIAGVASGQLCRNVACVALGLLQPRAAPMIDCLRRCARAVTLAAFLGATIAANLIAGRIRRGSGVGGEPGALDPEPYTKPEPATGQHLHDHPTINRPCYTPGKGPRHMRVQNQAFHARSRRTTTKPSHDDTNQLAQPAWPSDHLDSSQTCPHKRRTVTNADLPGKCACSGCLRG